MPADSQPHLQSSGPLARANESSSCRCRPDLTGLHFFHRVCLCRDKGLGHILFCDKVYQTLDAHLSASHLSGSPHTLNSLEEGREAFGQLVSPLTIVGQGGFSSRKASPMSSAAGFSRETQSQQKTWPL